MTYPTLTDRLAAAQAAADTARLDALGLEVSTLQSRLESCEALSRQPHASLEQTHATAAARNAVRQAESRLADARKEVKQAAAEAERLSLMLNAKGELDGARDQWTQASEAMTAATRKAMESRDNLDRLEAMRKAEQDALELAKAGQNAATLAELGLAEKPANSKTAAAYAKDAQAAQARIDALAEGIEGERRKGAAADAHVTECSEALAAAERAILTAHLHLAQRDHDSALMAHLAALDKLHGAELAALGHIPARVRLYDDATHEQGDRFNARAAWLKRQSEIGDL